MKSKITVRLDEELKQLLEKTAQKTGRSESEIIRESLRRQLPIITFRQLRNRILPFAESQGLLADEEIWEEIS